MELASKISKTLGMIPECMMSLTAWPASLRLWKVASVVLEAGGLGLILRVILVITPRVPSDPTNNRVRS